MTRTGSKIAECNGIHFRRVGNLETDPFSCLLMSFGLCSWFQSPLNSFGNAQEPHHVLVDAFCVGLRQLWALAQPYGIENDDKSNRRNAK